MLDGVADAVRGGATAGRRTRDAGVAVNAASRGGARAEGRTWWWWRRQRVRATRCATWQGRWKGRGRSSIRGYAAANGHAGHFAGRRRIEGAVSGGVLCAINPALEAGAGGAEDVLLGLLRGRVVSSPTAARGRR
jgi:hypothetical protein